MNIVVVTGSPRKNGNTEIMASVFAKSAAQTGHEVTVRVAMLLNSGADGVYDAAKAQLNSICSYLKWENKGVITISGMSEKGSMLKSEGLEQVRIFATTL